MKKIIIAISILSLGLAIAVLGLAAGLQSARADAQILQAKLESLAQLSEERLRNSEAKAGALQAGGESRTGQLESAIEAKISEIKAKDQQIAELAKEIESLRANALSREALSHKAPLIRSLQNLSSGLKVGVQRDSLSALSRDLMTEYNLAKPHLREEHATAVVDILNMCSDFSDVWERHVKARLRNESGWSVSAPSRLMEALRAEYGEKKYPKERREVLFDFISQDILQSLERRVSVALENLN